MNVLGIETSGQTCSVAVVNEEKLLAEKSMKGPRIHSIRLIPLIQEVINDAGLEVGQLQGVAVSYGPGSFTGIRIGVATAKIIAQVLDIPVVGVPSLEVLAQPLMGSARLVCPLVTARKGEVYAALYDTSGDMPVIVFGPAALELDQLVGLVRSTRRPFLFVGEAARSCREFLRRQLGTVPDLAPEALHDPRGAVVAELGLHRLKDGKGSRAEELVPEYVRLSSAEANWLKRNQGE
ncbi:MAG: tRNA (adenosine(37)-N6)-threonylcarbamoyltransferase complex dimerization subunit type 1 TsaB [Peptococcaceae bacterium]|nr:tRNA (adenosine(37)-N6)-threonylcarbamoyltransferase complex dimerization subunit type 1 TsaB [Peptococcaceae bacterium]